jgi:hypothetical protein
MNTSHQEAYHVCVHEVDVVQGMSSLKAKAAEAVRLELKCVQSRLGRPEELPDDCLRAAELAHRLNNLLCIIYAE